MSQSASALASSPAMNFARTQSPVTARHHSGSKQTTPRFQSPVTPKAAAAAKPAKKAAAKKKSADKSTKVASTAAKKSSHPKYLQMILEAIKSLNERNGSSRQAVCKYLYAHHQVDPNNSTQYIRSAILSGVKNGFIKQVKGQGFSGSFKLGDKAKAEEKKKPVRKASPKKETAAPKQVQKKSPAKKKAPVQNNQASAQQVEKSPAAKKTSAPKTNKAVTKKAATAKRSPVKSPKTPPVKEQIKEKKASRAKKAPAVEAVKASLAAETSRRASILLKNAKRTTTTRKAQQTKASSQASNAAAQH